MCTHITIDIYVYVCVCVCVYIYIYIYTSWYRVSGLLLPWHARPHGMHPPMEDTPAVRYPVARPHRLTVREHMSRTRMLCTYAHATGKWWWSYN